MSPIGIAVDSSGNIYVADNGAMSVFVFSALGSSTGTIIELPSPPSAGATPAWPTPAGIALDSSRKIYVTNDGPAA